MTGIWLAAVFLHPRFKPYPGHEADEIGASDALVEKHEGDATHRFYGLDKNVRSANTMKVDED